MCKIGFIAWIVLVFLSIVPFVRENNGVPFLSIMCLGWLIPGFGHICDQE